MKARVQADLLCPSQTDANMVRDALAQKLSTKVAVTAESPPSVVAPEEPGGAWHVLFDVRFTLRLDGEDVFSDVRAKWGGGQLRNRILTGSKASFHMCPHDDDPASWGPCTSATFEYTEAVK